VIVVAFTGLFSLIGLVYRGLTKRIEQIESKIPDDIMTASALRDHCKDEQAQCPFNARIAQIALDTAYLRNNVDKIIDKQELLREVTLPEKYLKIVEYEKNHLRIELMLKENVAEIKKILADKVDAINLVVDKFNLRGQ
jgi:hypothetical protein